MLPNYQKLFFKNRESSNGGGVAIYVKDNWNAKLIPIDNSFIDKIFESITIEISNGNHKILVSSLYRSPSPIANLPQSEQLNQFLITLNDFLANLNNFNLSTYIFTDSNINLAKLNVNNISNDYGDIILSNGFIQLITRDTRINGPSHSLIDHILTNDIVNMPYTGIIINDLSDHFFTFLEIKGPQSNRSKTKKIKKRVMNNTNIENFRNSLRNLSWINVTQSNNVNEALGLFWDDFELLYQLNFPLKEVKFNKNCHKINNFMTNGLLVSRNNKNRLHKLSINNTSIENTSKFRIYRNLYNKTLRAMKTLHYESSLKKSQKNPRKTWNILKELTTGNNVTQKIEKIVLNNTTINDNSEMAENFNNFFSNIGQTISDSVQPTVKTAESYLVDNPDIPNLDFIQLSPTCVIDIVKAMESKSSVDCDGISTSLLKKIINEISIPLAHVFNLSIQCGIFPTKLKTARVVPIFKSGNPNCTDNYRPISLLSTFSKILEKAIATQLINHLEINNLLYKHQYGFQKNKSTEHNLLSVTNFIFNAINRGEFCIGLFLDLKKAFDVCSHKILLKKLKYLDVRDAPLKWFKSYLENREQFVEVNSAKSSKSIINISVLQGSILGPILFLCYINDLWTCTNLATFMFADDTSAFKSGSDLPTLIRLMNTEINKIAIWFRANKMAVNVNKTKYIIFRSRGKRIDPQTNLDLIFDANEPNQPYNENLVYTLERFHDNHKKQKLSNV